MSEKMLEGLCQLAEPPDNWLNTILKKRAFGEMTIDTMPKGYLDKCNTPGNDAVHQAFNPIGRQQWFGIRETEEHLLLDRRYRQVHHDIACTS